MHNAAMLLNLIQLSMAVASIPTGLIVKLGRAPSGPLVLHGRKLNQVSVSSVAELLSAVGNSAVDKILVVAGTYEFTSAMCSLDLHPVGDFSAICIDRALTIEAQVPGSVVLDAKSERHRRRVFEIQSGGTAKLIGLNIRGGFPGMPRGGGGVYVASNAAANLEGCNIHDNDAKLGGGGCYVDSNGVANFEGCNIYDNMASDYGGGSGIYVASNGVANFEGCNIHDNTASSVCLHL